MVIPDNLKSAITKTCRYEPDLNPTYHQLAEYFNVAVIPARPYKPKDKSKAEVGVQIVERWIMARLRHQTFYSLAQLNGEIAKLLEVMNNKVMKQYQQSRQHLFDTLDKPALHPLPAQPYQYTQIKTVRVHIDYHVEIEKHYYSVPHQWVKKRLRAHFRLFWLCARRIRIFDVIHSMISALISILRVSLLTTNTQGMLVNAIYINFEE